MIDTVSQLREQRDEAERQVCDLRAELQRVKAILDQPDPHDFMLASEIEARFQRVRWAADGDEGKTDADWMWLIGALASKAVHNPGGDEAKRLHHITAVSAAACNWHAARLGQTDMRPGTAGATPHKAGNAAPLRGLIAYLNERARTLRVEAYEAVPGSAERRRKLDLADDCWTWVEQVRAVVADGSEPMGAVASA